MTSGAASPSPDVPAAQPAGARKVATATRPRFALFVATACGLGYLPKAPGTWGSLGGIILLFVPWLFLGAAVRILGGVMFYGFDPLLVANCLFGFAAASMGVWSANRAARFWQQKDPQRVVIDEVSGQHLTLLLGCTAPIWWRPESDSSGGFALGLLTFHSALGWKYLLLGFILFRLFDIWKPFPVRQAESLPGGWGIMADDWVAAIYAAIGLWIARAVGL